MVTSMRRSNRGFTLIELIVALFVAAVVLGVAIPSYKNFTETQKVKTASQALLSTVMLARAEAIKRNGDVVVSPIDGDWGKGWTVSFGGKELRRHDSLNGISVDSDDAAITFNRTGRAQAPATVGFCTGSNNVTRRNVAVAVSGQARVQHGEACA